MRFITVEEAAKKWNMSVRRTQDLCKMGRVAGAERWGRSWMIPADMPRPVDGRRSEVKKNADVQIRLIKKSPFLNMTELYREPGTADEAVKKLEFHPEAQMLLSAEIAHCRGDIDAVYKHARTILDSHSGFYAILSGGMLLGLCAIWKGDLNMWLQAKKHICEAPCTDEKHADIIELSIAASHSSLRIMDDYPDWFARGNFENLPHDAHPAARVYYAKYLMILAQEIAMGNIRHEGITGMGMMKTLPYIIEPMITQMVTDKIIMAEIYLRLICAVAYIQTGGNDRAVIHLNKAIKLCLADRLYTPLVTYRRQLGTLLDECIMQADPAAAKKVKELHKQYHEGWTNLHNDVLKKNVSASLSAREREVARLVAFGMSDAQISRQLFISESSVKSIVRSAKNKTGAEKRSELVLYI